MAQTLRRKQIPHMNLPPKAERWVQDMVAELEKTLQRMQLQIDQSEARIKVVEERLDALP